MFATALVLALGVASGSPSQSLQAAQAGYERAQMSGDRGQLEILLADDYVLVNGAGAREDKRAFIADLVAPGFRLKPYRIQRPVSRIWSNGAVLAGIAHLAGAESGRPFDGCIRFTDVWRRASGHWQVVFTQVAKAPPPIGGKCAE